MSDMYGGVDPRDIPCYPLVEASHHLRIPKSTVRSWAMGAGEPSPRLFMPATERPLTFSFWNLIEAEVLGALRRKHEVSMQKVRKALAFLSKELHEERPLITGKFLAKKDGSHLFIDFYGKLIDANKKIVHELNADMAASLERIEVAKDELASAYYPWLLDPKVHAPEESDPKIVRVDPRVAFGRPVVIGTGVTTEVLFDRHEAGDSIEVLTKDYALAAAVVTNAIEWERAQAEAS